MYTMYTMYSPGRYTRGQREGQKPGGGGRGPPCRSVATLSSLAPTPRLAKPNLGPPRSLQGAS